VRHESRAGARCERPARERSGGWRAQPDGVFAVVAMRIVLMRLSWNLTAKAFLASLREGNVISDEAIQTIRYFLLRQPALIFGLLPFGDIARLPRNNGQKRDSLAYLHSELLSLLTSVFWFPRFYFFLL
jgi:hypothetical protein